MILKTTCVYALNGEFTKFEFRCL